MRRLLLSCALVTAGLVGIGQAAADQLLLLSATPGSPHNTFHTRLATIVGKYTDLDVQVSLGITPPKMQIEVARGDADLAFSAPTVTNFMRNKQAMFAQVDAAPELYKKLRGITSHDGGLYTFVTFADSGINSLADVKGKTLSLAIPGDAANLVLIQMIRAETGYEPNKDYTMSPLHGAAAVQAFQDGHIDLWASPAAQPNPVVQEYALTRKIRLLGLSKETIASDALKATLSLPGRYAAELPADIYGDNQVNDQPVTTLGTTNALVTSVDADEELVYQVTKAMWDHLDEMWAAGDFMPRLINPENAFKQLDVPLHKGALRYYREAGFEVPQDLIPAEAD